jgi:hypothetical protein
MTPEERFQRIESNLQATTETLHVVALSQAETRQPKP